MKGYIYIDYVNKSQLKYIVGKRYKFEKLSTSIPNVLLR